jgi:hypothetical protein
MVATGSVRWQHHRALKETEFGLRVAHRIAAAPKGAAAFVGADHSATERATRLPPENQELASADGAARRVACFGDAEMRSDDLRHTRRMCNSFFPLFPLTCLPFFSVFLPSLSACMRDLSGSSASKGARPIQSDGGARCVHRPSSEKNPRRCRTATTRASGGELTWQEASTSTATCLQYCKNPVPCQLRLSPFDPLFCVKQSAGVYQIKRWV